VHEKNPPHPNPLLQQAGGEEKNIAFTGIVIASAPTPNRVNIEKELLIR